VYLLLLCRLLLLVDTTYAPSSGNASLATYSVMLLLYIYNTQIPPRMLDPLSSLRRLSTAALLFAPEAFAAVTHAAEHVALARKEMPATPWTTVAILRTACPSAQTVHAVKMDAVVLVELALETMSMYCIAWECRLPLRMDRFHPLVVKAFQSATTLSRRAQAAPTNRFALLIVYAMIPSRTWLTWS
jgi:hypothetical protein